MKATNNSDKVRTQEGILLKPVTAAMIKRGFGILKGRPDEKPLVEEWADIVGFAAHKIRTKQIDAGFGSKETKALKSTERVLHLEPHPAYPSGSRFGLHDCPLEWSAFADQLSKALNPI